MSFRWNYGDVIEAMEIITPPKQAALIHGNRIINWEDMRRRSNNLAKNLLKNGIKVGDKIAFYMRNCPEYSEGINAALHALGLGELVSPRRLWDGSIQGCFSRSN